MEPQGSISSRLAGADEGSQGRRSNDQDAAGHSSLPKPLSTQFGEMTDASSTIIGARIDARPRHGMNLLVARQPAGGISVIGKPEWTEIEITVDSGACEIVMPMGMCEHIGVLASAQYLEGF